LDAALITLCEIINHNTQTLRKELGENFIFWKRTLKKAVEMSASTAFLFKYTMFWYQNDEMFPFLLVPGPDI
jgi:hypothetical protein